MAAGPIISVNSPPENFQTEIYRRSLDDEGKKEDEGRGLKKDIGDIISVELTMVYPPGGG